MIREALKSLACVAASLTFGALAWWLAVAVGCAPNPSAESAVLSLICAVSFIAMLVSLAAAFICADAAGRATT